MFLQNNNQEFLQAGYRFAVSLCHDEDQAEDLVQEAWVRLLAKKGGVQGKSILFKTVHNLFIDQYRRDKLMVLTNSELLESKPDLSFDPLADHNLLVEEMEVLLGRLEAQEREVLFLYYYESQGIKEICDIIDRPRGSVLSLLHRGREKLARLVNESGEVDYGR